jgi:ABC-type dipeptide/oligopeptide/nickel transport system permease subunit
MTDFWRRFRRSRPGVVGLVLVVSLVALALAAPALAPRSPLQTSPAAFRAPGADAMLGTDNLGRDVWAGLLHGARVSLMVGICSADSRP